MDAPDSDNSISGSISIPHWMKSRTYDRYDMTLGAVSPPNQDDSFFYIPYPKQPEKNSATPKVIVASDSKPQTSSFTSQSTVSLIASDSITGKHTLQCLKYLDSKEPSAMEKVEQKLSQKQIKSLGTDDGFKGEAAQCGHSVVQVAHQMVAERLVGRPFKLNTDNEADQSNLDSERPPFKHHRVRRGSKSLPVSPISTPDSTPKIQRKNRFFTGAFVETPEETGKFRGSWLVAGLLGTHREKFSDSLQDLSSDDNNNDGLEKRKHLDTLRRNKSSSMILQSADSAKPETGAEASLPSAVRSGAVLTKSGSTGTEATNVKHRPKASELREMNFWSPTSM